MSEHKTRLQQVVKEWAEKLGISHYKFFINIVKPEEMDELSEEHGTAHDYAQVQTVEEKQEVSIFVNEKYLKEEPGETENTIVHELVHVRMNQVMELFVDTINSYVTDKNAKEFLSRQLDKLEHQVVVGITRALTGGNG